MSWPIESPDSTRGRVVGLFRKPARGSAAESLTRADLVSDLGVRGDAYARAGSRRQVLLIEQENLADLRLEPGILSENVTTAGLDLHRLPAGTRLRIGGAVVELTMLCPPCEDMNAIRPGLRAELVGRRGVLGRVVEGGEVALRDEVSA